jgi:hypothetical protein
VRKLGWRKLPAGFHDESHRAREPFRTRNGVGACWAFLFDLRYQPHRIQQVRIDNDSMTHGKTHGKDSNRDRNDEGCLLGSQFAT